MLHRNWLNSVMLVHILHCTESEQTLSSFLLTKRIFYWARKGKLNLKEELMDLAQALVLLFLYSPITPLTCLAIGTINILMWISASSLKSLWLRVLKLLVCTCFYSQSKSSVHEKNFVNYIPIFLQLLKELPR